MQPTGAMKILICDDHAIFREGLRSLLRPLDAEVVEAADAESALARVAAEPDVDVALLDLAMPGTDGWTALRALRSEHPHLPVVIVSASEAVDDVRNALGAGASGFIPKSSSTQVFRSALELVLGGSIYIPPVMLEPLGGSAAAPVERASAPERRAGRRRKADELLTVRQREVLFMMSRGLTNREIAEALGVAQGTVKSHLSTVFEILDVTNRTEAVLAMRDLGLEEA
jgi:DNA-binding NarL/FixJ family response regulator